MYRGSGGGQAGRHDVGAAQHELDSARVCPQLSHHIGILLQERGQGVHVSASALKQLSLAPAAPAAAAAAVARRCCLLGCPPARPRASCPPGAAGAAWGTRAHPACRRRAACGPAPAAAHTRVCGQAGRQGGRGAGRLSGKELGSRQVQCSAGRQLSSAAHPPTPYASECTLSTPGSTGAGPPGHTLMPHATQHYTSAQGAHSSTSSRPPSPHPTQHSAPASVV